MDIINIPITRVRLNAQLRKQMGEPIEITVYHETIVGETPKKYKLTRDGLYVSTVEKKYLPFNEITIYGYEADVQINKWIYASENDKEKIEETMKELKQYYKNYLLKQMDELEKISPVYVQ